MTRYRTPATHLLLVVWTCAALVACSGSNEGPSTPAVVPDITADVPAEDLVAADTEDTADVPGEVTGTATCPGSCDDGNDCTTDSCDETGTCHSLALPDNATCDLDSLACTTDHCASGGMCVAGGLAENSCGIVVGGVPTCFALGDFAPDNPCLICAPASAMTAWTPREPDAECQPTQKGCIRFACSETAQCVGVPTASLCPATASSCSEPACDLTFGCFKAPLSNETACEGDNIACTKEFCDGKGACPATGTPSDAGCDDKASCTDDACTAAGCTHTPVAAKCDDGNACTTDTCQPDGEGAQDGSGCVYGNLSDVACPDDGLACTTGTCQSGTCEHAIDAETCLVEGTCKAKGDESA
ncbi:MAG: hypothetical protein ACOYOB_19460, partial [Myxococcota bacterium]